MPLLVPLKGVPFAALLWGQCHHEIGPRTQNASEFRFCGPPSQRAARPIVRNTRGSVCGRLKRSRFALVRRLCAFDWGQPLPMAHCPDAPR
jgi:hypothetical protein